MDPCSVEYTRPNRKMWVLQQENFQDDVDLSIVYKAQEDFHFVWLNRHTTSDICFSLIVNFGEN